MTSTFQCLWDTLPSEMIYSARVVSVSHQCHSLTSVILWLSLSFVLCPYPLCLCAHGPLLSLIIHLLLFVLQFYCLERNVLLTVKF